MKTNYFSYKLGNLAKGCKLCIKGEKSVLFITGICPNNCFYCPIADEKNQKDIVQINEIKSKEEKKIINEIKLCKSEGIGITGGDPLVKLNRTIKIIKNLKKEFGKKFHTHLYTTLKLANYKTIEDLKKAGLDEIRFHLFYYKKENYKLLEKILKLKDKSFKIGVEVPILPDKLSKLKKFVKYLDKKIDFLNLNEMEFTDNNFNKIATKYKIDELTYQVKNSLKTGLELLNFIKKEKIKLNTHLCTVKLKNRIQLAKRLKLRAETVSKKFDKITSYGTLIRGIIETKKLSKDKEKKVEKLIGKIYFEKNKSRYIVDRIKLKKNKTKVKKVTNRLFVVEEWPIDDEFIFEKEKL